jgi:hypothetical protein
METLLLKMKSIILYPNQSDVNYPLQIDLMKIDYF